MPSTFKLCFAAAGFVTLASFSSRRADACSCATGVLVSPPDLSVNVPLNAVVIYESPGAPTLFDETHNVEIAATVEPFLSRMWLLRPSQPLPEQSTIRVSPSQFPGAPFPRFVTGTTTRDTAPEYSGATSLRASFFDVSQSPCKSSCWSGDSYRRLRFEYAAPPAESSLLLLEVRRASDDAGAPVETVPIYRQFREQALPTAAETGGCTFGVPKFAAGEQVCARIVAYDVTGRRSDPSPEICTTAAACVPAYNQGCTVLDTCGPTGEPSDGGDAGPGVPDVAEGGPNEPDATPPIDPPDAADAATPPTKDAAWPPGNQPDVGDSNPPPNGPSDSGGCSIGPGAAHRSGAISALFTLFAVAALVRRRGSTHRL